MNIKINLIQDWENLILQKIAELKNDGFLFDLDYDDWITKRRSRFEREKKRLEKEKKSLTDNDEDADSIDSIIASKDKEIARTGLENKHKDDLILNYYTLEYVRLIRDRRRQVKEPLDFYCPPEYQKCLNFLLNKVRKGESLLPHLSRQIFNPYDNSSKCQKVSKQKKGDETLDPSKDGLLFDWDIHHFHLGLKFDQERLRLIKGTKQVLYAIVSDNFFYLLAIKDHGHWVNKDLPRIARDNFPEIIDPYRHTESFSLPWKVNESDHKKSRKVGIDTLLDLDGVYYSPPGGGFISGGGSRKAQYTRLAHHHRYLDAQEIINRELQKVLAVNPIKENTSLDCIQLKMSELENDRITVKCQEYGTKVVLFFDEQDNFRRLSIQRSYDEGSFLEILN